MTQQIKITAYVVLLGLAIWFGWGFFKNLSAATAAAPDPGSAENVRETPSPPLTNQDPAIATAETNLATNAVASTNLAAPPPPPTPKKAQAAAPPQSRGKNTS